MEPSEQRTAQAVVITIPRVAVGVIKVAVDVEIAALSRPKKAYTLTSAVAIVVAPSSVYLVVSRP